MEKVNKTTANNVFEITNITTMANTNLKTGILTAFGLVFYFIIMKFFNLHHYLELHYLNIVFLFFGIRYAIKQKMLMSGEIKYFEGIKSGLLVTLISVSIFDAFMVIYATVIDPSFLDFLKENILLGQFFSKYEIIFNIIGILAIEGLSSGFILTYMLMQYYKAESSETK